MPLFTKWKQQKNYWQERVISERRKSKKLTTTTTTTTKNFVKKPNEKKPTIRPTIYHLHYGLGVYTRNQYKLQIYFTYLSDDCLFATYTHIHFSTTKVRSWFFFDFIVFHWSSSSSSMIVIRRFSLEYLNIYPIPD